MAEDETQTAPAAPGGRIGSALRIGSLACVALALAAYGLHPGLRATLNEGIGLLASGNLEGLRTWGASLGGWAPLATSGLMVVQAIAAPIPAVFVTWTNSWLFGPFWGGVLSILSANLAALLCFLLARAWGEPLVARFVSARRLEQSEAFLERHGVAAVLVSRLVPFVPFDPISYAAGLARMRAWPFFWATLLGQIPAGMTYSYLGQEITRPARLILFGACAFAALVVLGVSVRKALLSDPETAQ